jgi:FkbM family methyltransferase
MPEHRWWRDGVTRLLQQVLAWRGLRRRLVFQLKQDYFSELDLRVPVGAGLVCPIRAEENLYSFAEIFCAAEYGGVLERIPPPRRWLDLGAHAGYFTLFLAARGRRRDWQAVLVEPDPRMRPVLEAMLGLNGFTAQARLLAGVLGSGEATRRFVLRPGMLSSSALGDGAAGAIVELPVVTADQIRAALPPPYDLVKLDIEGGEYEFVHHYEPICRETRALVLEWHAPTPTDPRVGQLRERLRSFGLVHSWPLREPVVAPVAGPLAATGLELFSRESAGAKSQPSHHQGALG